MFQARIYLSTIITLRVRSRFNVLLSRGAAIVIQYLGIRCEPCYDIPVVYIWFGCPNSSLGFPPPTKVVLLLSPSEYILREPLFVVPLEKKQERIPYFGLTSAQFLPEGAKKGRGLTCPPSSRQSAEATQSSLPLLSHVRPSKFKNQVQNHDLQ